MLYAHNFGFIDVKLPNLDLNIKTFKYAKIKNFISQIDIRQKKKLQAKLQYAFANMSHELIK